MIKMYIQETYDLLQIPEKYYQPIQVLLTQQPVLPTKKQIYIYYLGQVSTMDQYRS